MQADYMASTMSFTFDYITGDVFHSLNEHSRVFCSP